MQHTAETTASAPDSGPLVALLKALVRCRSITPDDAGCQLILNRNLERLGFDCEAMPFGDVSNLWARRGGSGPVLCFAGHTDVVPPGPPERWRSDPFEADIRDGVLYARGAADMKGSLAAMLVAIERFVARHPDHDGSIAMLITSDEEGPARDGTAKVMETLGARDETIDWCVIGEPSSRDALGDVVRIGRRGSLSGSLRVSGVEGHVAYPHLADNPIGRFAPALAELHAICWDDGNDDFPPTSFQMVDIRSGSGAVNVIPDTLTARFNFRYSTVWDHDALAARVDEVLRAHGLDYEIEWHLSGRPFLTRRGVLIDAVVQAVEAETGRTPSLSTGGGTSDGRFIAPSGADVIELGPINASIHKVDEHVRLADLERLARIYQRIIEILLL